MNYYTSQIPLPLAEKLKEKGMPIRYAKRLVNACPNSTRRVDVIDSAIVCPMYCEVFDWLMERGIFIEAYPLYSTSDKMYSDTWCFSLMSNKLDGAECDEIQEGWHEAADAAIEKALTLI